MQFTQSANGDIVIHSPNTLIPGVTELIEDLPRLNREIHPAHRLEIAYDYLSVVNVNGVAASFRKFIGRPWR